MSKTTRHAVAALLFLTCIFSKPLSAQDWNFRHETNGVKVYQRSSSSGQELKLVTQFSCNLSSLVALFNNVTEYPRWGYKVKNTRMVSRISDNEFIFYQQFDFPWPLSDRDVIMHAVIRQDPDTRVVTLQSSAAPDQLPEYSDFVRVRKAFVRWTLVPLPNNQVQAEYWLNTDPGGLLPDWTVNMAADSGPVQTVQNMKKILSEEQYRNARVAYIKN